MRNLKSNEIAALIKASNAAKREIPYADCEVGQDLDRDARMQILRDLEDSDLINVGLLDEIEDRILEGNPYYVIALVKKQRIADLMAEGVEDWKAREIVDIELSTVSKSMAGFAGVDSTEEKLKAQKQIAERREATKAEHLKNLETYGECRTAVYADSTGDYFEELTQVINISTKRKMSKDVEDFKAADRAKLDRINQMSIDDPNRMAEQEDVIERTEVETVYTGKRIIYQDFEKGHNNGHDGSDQDPDRLAAIAAKA